MALVTLPTELLDEIAHHCAEWPRPVGNLLALRLTCRRFNSLFRSQMNRTFVELYDHRYWHSSYQVTYGGHYVHQLLCKLIRAGNETLLRELLDAGADVNPGVQRGLKQKYRRRRFRIPRHVPLIEAIVNGKENLAIMLVDEYRADVDVVDRKNRDALFLAISQGMTALVELFLQEANAPSNPWMFCHGSAGDAAWRRAITSGHTDILSLLINASHRAPCGPHHRRRRCSEALQVAAEVGNDASAKLILSQPDCDPNLAHNSSKRPIVLAARNGHWPVVKLLLETGLVSPDTRGELNRTVLFFVAQHGACDIAKYLIGLDGVDPNSQDRFGRTPLMHAVVHNQPALVTLLLESGLADVNQTDNRKNTALVISVKKDLVPIALMLLARADIDIHMRNLDGRTATQIAHDHSLTEIVDLLLDMGGEKDTRDKDDQNLSSHSLEMHDGGQGR